MLAALPFSLACMQPLPGFKMRHVAFAPHASKLSMMDTVNSVSELEK